MVILYPHNQRFMLKRAHDILVVKTCHYLAQQGHQVFLLMGKTEADLEKLLGYYGLKPHPNLTIIQLPILRREKFPRLSWHGVFHYSCYKAIRDLGKNNDFDLIYLSELKLARYLLRRRNKIKLPFVYEIHGLKAEQYRLADALESEVVSGADLLVTTAESLRERLTAIYRPTADIVKVPLATDLPEKLPPFSAPTTNKPWRIFYVGQLYPLQGVDLLLEAVALLPRENLRIEIVGGRPDHIQHLTSRALSLGLSNVEFHGFVSPADILKKMDGSHILVAPCRAEGKMPFVAHTKIYEYLALGRPIVAADLPAIREELIDGHNAYLYEPGNPDSLANCLKKVISDPETSLILAKNAKDLASSFSWKSRAERLESAFGVLVEKARLPVQ